MIRTFKFRIRPNRAQVEALDAMLADTRAQVAAWNAEDGASE